MNGKKLVIGLALAAAAALCAREMLSQSFPLTPHLSLCKPPVGAKNWGDCYNHNSDVIDSAVYSLQNPYQGAWSNVTTYTSFNTVTYGGSVYQSRQASNIGNQPDISGSAWVRMGSAPVLFQVGGSANASQATLNLLGGDLSGVQITNPANGDVRLTVPPMAWSPTHKSTCFGDSLCSSSTNWARLAANISGNGSNYYLYGVSGAQAADVSAQIFTNNYLPTLTDYMLTYVVAGTNEVDFKGPGSYETGVYIPALLAVLLKSGLTEEYWVHSGSFTVTGSTHLETASNYNATWTDAAGSTISVPITTLTPSGPIFILQRVTDGASGTGTYCVVPSGTSGCSGSIASGTVSNFTTPAMATLLGQTSSVVATVTTNVPAGSYSVNFTQTSSGTSGMGIVQVGAPPIKGTVRLPPTVLVQTPWQQQGYQGITGNLPNQARCTGVTPQNGQAVPNNADDTLNCGPYRADQLATVLLLRQWLDVRLFDPRTVVPGYVTRGVANPAQAPYFADALHNTPLGDAAWAQGALRVMNPAPGTGAPSPAKTLSELGSFSNPLVTSAPIQAGFNFYNNAQTTNGTAFGRAFGTVASVPGANITYTNLLVDYDYAPDFGGGHVYGCHYGFGPFKSITLASGLVNPTDGFEGCTLFMPANPHNVNNGAIQITDYDSVGQMFAFGPFAGGTGTAIPFVFNPGAVQNVQLFSSYTSGVLTRIGYRYSNASASFLEAWGLNPATGQVAFGRPVGLPTSTVSALPSATTYGIGSIAVVTDWNGTPGTCTGGGTGTGLAISTGSAWLCK